MNNIKEIKDIRKLLILLINASDKQIPVKPDSKIDDDDTICPMCSKYVETHQGYCSECGQKLNWS